MAADDNAPHEQYRRPTKRGAFLAAMEQIAPWAALCADIEPHDPWRARVGARWACGGC